MPTKPIVVMDGIGDVLVDSSGANQNLLTDVSFSLYPGKITAIIGPDGSGKSALFSILACLNVASTGTYHLFDQEVNYANERVRNNLRKRKIGLVFQETTLVEEISLQRNVEIPLEISGGKRYKVRASDALAYVGLSDFLSHTPEKISFFQKKLTGLARAIVTNPSILLLNDPFRGLNWISSLRYLELLQKITFNSPIAIFLTTTDENIAMFCNHCISIQDGRLVNNMSTNKQISASSERYKIELREIS
ncbi:MAG: hypothetical protein CL776_02010 [Chloroflexi bacterium]|nr:hypothetical protein [Chloroflexota bacterium]|tara:strand:- start:3880 stop:4626 length:747 start_codon:yes stop_codon:yes gene_type:complete